MSDLYQRLRQDDAAVLLVDHQAGLCSLVRDFQPDEFKNNVLALAALAKYFRLPTILTTSFEQGPNGPILPELKAMFPDAPYIARPGQINAWDNEEFVAAVKATGLGIPNDQLIFDPGIGPIASDMEGMVRRVLETIRTIHADPAFAGCHISVGLSNFSHMLPSKKADGTPVKSAIESAFLTRAMPYGLDFIIGSVKRRYEVLPEGHPALLCLDGAVRAANEDSLELVVSFYSE